MRLSVIITTFNQPAWLEKVLWGYEVQTHADFEVVVAEDGEDPAVEEVLARLRRQSALAILHLKQARRGYGKCRILNRAVGAAQTDYLLFTDGDCVPRRDFVEQHARHARRGCFLSGGAVRLPLSTSQALTRDAVQSQQAFDLGWLRLHGLPNRPLKNLKLRCGPRLGSILSLLTPTRATWNGGNASCWKADALAVNGFDERMGYGGQDREFGERLVNLGLRSRQLRYTAICIHLDHPRGYKDDDSVLRNLEIRHATRASGLTRTDFGIAKDSGPVSTQH